MSWLKEVIGTEKAIIAMCHLQAMPGDPYYDKEKGMKWVVEKAKEDLEALQEGGVDAVMFSNEFSLPYLTKVEPVTTACMRLWLPWPVSSASCSPISAFLTA